MVTINTLNVLSIFNTILIKILRNKVHWNPNRQFYHFEQYFTSSFPEDQWKKVTNLKDIENILISHNQGYLSQAQGTPRTINPLQDLLGTDNFTPFGNSLLLGTAHSKQLPLSSLQKNYLYELRKVSTTLSSPLSHDLCIETMSQGFKKWNRAQPHHFPPTT